MKASFALILILFFVSCKDDEQVCKTVKAFSGYVSSPEDVEVAYDKEYNYFYEGSTLVKMQEYSFDTRSLVRSTDYSYNTEGLLVKKIVEFANISQEHHYYYEFTSDGIVTTTYVISGADTLSVTENTSFYIEDPQDKVYHSKVNNQSYKFQNGNVVEFGSYEVTGDDTVATFLERYRFDNNLSYMRTLAFKETIPNSFEWAGISSGNNLIHAEYIGGGWEKSYSFEYNGSQLTRYRDLNTGHTVDFQYQCN